MYFQNEPRLYLQQIYIVSFLSTKSSTCQGMVSIISYPNGWNSILIHGRKTSFDFDEVSIE